MSDLFEPSLQEMIVDAEREVRMRINVYPKLVINGRMKQDDADRKIAIMRAIVERLRGLKP